MREHGLGNTDSSAGRRTVGDEFMDDMMRLESVAPDIVSGKVDLMCRECGRPHSLNYNADCSDTYICPQCGVIDTISIDTTVSSLAIRSRSALCCRSTVNV